MLNPLHHRHSGVPKMPEVLAWLGVCAIFWAGVLWMLR